MAEIRLQARRELTRRWYRERNQELIREVRWLRRQWKKSQRLVEDIVRHHPGLAIGTLAELDTCVIIRAPDDPSGSRDRFEIRSDIAPRNHKKSAPTAKCANGEGAHA
jgi:hypothetical protein